MAIAPHPIKAVDHDTLQAAINLAFPPEEELKVLHPLKVADCHATGICQNVKAV